MTLTEARPEASAGSTAEADASAAPRRGNVVDHWIDTTDHKRIGQLFIFAAILFAAAGGVFGELIAAEHVSSGIQIVGQDFGRFFSFHVMVMDLLFLTPLWIGIATYIVPLQIGATRLALPKLHAFSFWLYLVGGAGLIASYCISAPAGVGLSLANPEVALGDSALAIRADRATNLWMLSLIAVALATLIACISLVTTIATERAEGMTYLRLPSFSLSILGFATGMTFATPVFLAGLSLLYVSEHSGLRMFGPGHGAVVVYQHTLWIFGSPQVFLLVVPALGVACELVATAARRTLLPDHRVVAGLLFATTAATFLVWAQGTGVGDAVVLPTASLASSIIVAPIALLALLWLGTLGLAAKDKRLKPSVNLVWVVGFAVALLAGAGNVVFAALRKNPVLPGTMWTTGHVHLVAFGAPTLLAVGALWHWSPKIWGRAFSQVTGALAFLLLFGGVAGLAAGGYWGGYDAVPAVDKFVGGTEKGVQTLVALGGGLVILGVLVLVLEILRVGVAKKGKAAGDDPYEGLTLEWATTSPPPVHNFETLPEIRSATPLADLRAASNGGAD